MITFKEYLTESNRQPLYHTTHFSNLENILVTGLNGSTHQNLYHGKGQATKGVYGVSAARTRQASLEYYKKNISWHGNYVILLLDQNQLKNHFKIRSVDFFQTKALLHDDEKQPRRSEDEEFIVIKHNNLFGTFSYGFIPSKYITGIMYLKNPTNLVSTSYLETIEKMKRTYPDKQWIPISR